jgi:hypothetical protein
MPHALYTFDFQPKTPPETPGVVKFGSMLRKLYEQLVRIVNGQLSFGKGISPDNIAGAWGAVADTGLANTDFTITHNLLYVPTGFILINQSLGGAIYQGVGAWTTTTITLRCTVAHDKILVFII